jgi:hypothetical protein
VEYGDQVLKSLPIRGLVGEQMVLEDYLEQLYVEARTAMLPGRPVGRQRRLLEHPLTDSYRASRRWPTFAASRGASSIHRR